jgi:hypothetical protein
MSETDNSFYFLFAIIAISYGMYMLTRNCILRLRSGAETGDGEGNSDNINSNITNINNINNNNNNGNDNGNDNDNNDAAGKRRALIRGRLDFRKIVPPSSEEETVTTTITSELPDLERGEERRYDSYVSNNSDNDNDNDNDNNSNNDNINSNVSRASLGQLVIMGFGVHASTKALNAVGGSDIEVAMDWIFAHSADPDLNVDPFSNSKTAVTTVDLDAGGTGDDGLITAADSNNDNTNTNKNSTVRSLFSAPFSYFNRVGGTAARNEECCSICLEPFSIGDTVGRLKKDANAANTDRAACNHCFHEDCILEWLQNHDECPLCRVDMINTPTNA